MAKYAEDFELRIGATDKTAGAISSVQRSLVKMAAGLVSVTAAATALKFAFGAAMESEAAFNDLAAAVKRAGASWKAEEKSLRAFTTQMQMLTATSDELSARSLQLLLDYGMNISTAMRTMTTAADLAAARSIDLKTAVDLLGKAYVGFTGTLTRYGIIIDQTMSQSEKFESVMKKINETMGGAAAEKMKATISQWQLFKELIGDLAESAGSVATGPANTGLKKWNDLLFAINNVSGGLEKLNIIMFAVLDKVITGGIDFEKYVQRVKDEQQALLEKAEVQRLEIELRQLNGEVIMTAEQGLARFKQLIGEEKTETQKLIEELRAKIALRKQEIAAIDDYTKKQQAMNVALGIEARERHIGTPGQRTGPAIYGYGELGNMHQYINQAADALGEVEEKFKDIDYATQSFAASIQSAFASLGDGIVDILWGVEDAWDNILKNMLQAFTRTLAQMAMKYAAASFLNVLFPGAGFLTSGLGLLGKTAPETATNAKITLNFNGDIIGEESYVRERMIPLIEGASRRGFSAIALKGY
jgi:hypothetical protein